MVSVAACTRTELNGGIEPLPDRSPVTHQYLLTFLARPSKKANWQRIRLMTEVPNADLVGPGKLVNDGATWQNQGLEGPSAQNGRQGPQYVTRECCSTRLPKSPALSCVSFNYLPL